MYQRLRSFLMGRFNYISVIEDQLKSIDDLDFISISSRLLQKLNQDIIIQPHKLNLLSTEGMLLDSVFYRTVVLQNKKSVKISSLIPRDNKKFSFVTIITNKLEFFDDKNRSILSKNLPGLVFNYWGISELSNKISAFDLEDIKYILGDSSSVLISYLETSSDESKDRQILSKIFDFLFDTPIPDGFQLSKDEDGKLIHIEKKIPLNFGKNHYNRVRELYLKCFPNILLVEEFIKFQLAVNRRSVDALLEKIYSNYCEVKGIQNRRVPVVHFDIIEKLARSLLPSDLVDNTEYLFNAKSIVLFFFEACEYGQKYEEEPASLFDKEK